MKIKLIYKDHVKTSLNTEEYTNTYIESETCKSYAFNSWKLKDCGKEIENMKELTVNLGKDYSDDYDCIKDILIEDIILF